MQILATNTTVITITSITLSYTNLSGAPASVTGALPAVTTGNTAPVLAAPQPGSAFISVVITIGTTPYTVPFDSALPSGLGVQVYWAQNSNTSVVVLVTEQVGA